MITKETLKKLNNTKQMEHHTFVYNYQGKHRSDLKESQKAIASTEVMDKNAEFFRNINETTNTTGPRKILHK